MCFTCHKMLSISGLCAKSRVSASSLLVFSLCFSLSLGGLGFFSNSVLKSGIPVHVYAEKRLMKPVLPLGNWCEDPVIASFCRYLPTSRVWILSSIEPENLLCSLGFFALKFVIWLCIEIPVVSLECYAESWNEMKMNSRSLKFWRNNFLHPFSEKHNHTVFMLPCLSVV